MDQYCYIYLMKFSPVKSVISKWLLTAIVVFGFFTFSGLTIQTTNRFIKPDTTLVAGFVNRVSKSISYSAVLKVTNRSCLSNLTSQLLSLRALSFLHSREADIAITQASGLFILNKQVGYLFFIRTYSPGPGDDNHLFIG
jgi:uncharacterized MnhB-related membrane protein